MTFILAMYETNVLYNALYMYLYQYIPNIRNRIGGVMVNVLASSAVDRGFEPRSNQTKDYEIGS